MQFVVIESHFYSTRKKICSIKTKAHVGSFLLSCSFTPMLLNQNLCLQPCLSFALKISVVPIFKLFPFFPLKLLKQARDLRFTDYHIEYFTECKNEWPPGTNGEREVDSCQK